MYKKNLVDQKFGRLTVVAEAQTRNHRQYWLCRCQCGNQIEVATNMLTTGKKQSCGCLQAESRKHDLTQKRFGRLIAICPTDKCVHNRIIWKCLCDCGNIAYIRSDHLTRGVTTSCGCFHKEMASKNCKNTYEANLQDGTNVGKIKSNKLPKNNTSGVKGVYWHTALKKWYVQLTFKNIVYHLGYYVNFYDAVTARKNAEQKYFGEYLKNK